MPEDTVAAEVQPRESRAREAATALQRLGFRVLHVGTTISVQASRPLWESTFNVSFERRTRTQLPEVEGSEVEYHRAIKDDMRIPEELQDRVDDVQFVEPPELY